MKRFHLLSLILMIFTFVLIAAGGLVTSTGSGLSVPDWPLSFGMLFPEMKGGVQYEHTHRVIAGVVLLLTIALAWMARREVPRRLAVLAFAGVPLVLLQALLGGMTVLLLLPLPVSVFHACLGQSFFALTVSLWWLSAENRLVGADATPDLPITRLQRKLGHLTLGVLLLQLFLGAYVRHSGGHAVLEHIGGAFVVTAFVASLALISRAAYPDHPGVRAASTLVLICLVLQIALGYGSFLWTVLKPASAGRPLERILITAAHQTVGALILAFSTALFLAGPGRRDLKRVS
ncbi:MAG: COX15/CtaA family protein [Candidatus Omnitrophica bacterium]|jgi:cytochrome c oxidase assembly protein subunit 15|nr:COX15/CtaA family protein [Candidatus Omnitrophota bacterium]